MKALCLMAMRIKVLSIFDDVCNVLLKVMSYQGPWFASRDKRKAEQNKTLL